MFRDSYHFAGYQPYRRWAIRDQFNFVGYTIFAYYHFVGVFCHFPVSRFVCESYHVRGYFVEITIFAVCFVLNAKLPLPLITQAAILFSEASSG